MKTTYCNPLDLGYRYSHMKEGKSLGHREGADPTLVYFKGRYYAFVSMSAGFWHSSDLLNWEFHPDPELLIYDYAPDVRQIGDRLYFCASRGSSACPILSSRDPLHEKFIQVSAPCSFCDPDIFADDDGRVYLYRGCSNSSPICGIELDADTLLPIGDWVPLIHDREYELGYERIGDDGDPNKVNGSLFREYLPLWDPVSRRIVLPEGATEYNGCSADYLTAMFREISAPYIEGAFMTKHGGRYYLQYAAPGTEYNTYCDGVYVGDSPLGPFTLQESNPFSSKPGGFITGAGHGSTVEDGYGNFWHAATMRISVNHIFERRIGLFPAGFDRDGVLFCNQNFADYPHDIPAGKFDTAAQGPKWMLLSYNKKATASSGDDPGKAVNEDIRNWWSAETNAPGEWLCVDLGEEKDIRAVQVNFADQGLYLEFPAEEYGSEFGDRRIELEPQISRFVIEYSSDGDSFSEFETVERECSNAYSERQEGVWARFVRVRCFELPYNQVMRISGLRVFGLGHGALPDKAKAEAKRTDPLEAVIAWEHIGNADGCNIRYGISPDKLYMSRLVYGTDSVKLTTLIAGQEYYAAADSFNENGITSGDIIKIN